jgi:mRNA interferase MazF
VVNRGEVWWYEHPDAGRRPFLILARDELLPLLNQVLAVPTTTRIRGIPTEVELGREDGMPRRCALALDSVTLIRSALCTDRVTTLSPQRMSEVCRALAFSQRVVEPTGRTGRCRRTEMVLMR